MILTKDKTNALETLLGERTEIIVNVTFRCGQSELCHLSRDTVKTYEGDTRYHFSWDNGECNVTTQGNGMRYGSDSDWDVVSVIDCDNEMRYLDCNMKTILNEFEIRTKEVFSVIKDYMKVNDIKFINLQSSACDAIYTHIFNDQKGKNEEYRVLALTMFNGALMITCMLADEEDDIKIPFSDKALQYAYNEGGNRYLRCVPCCIENVDSVELAYNLARFLYPHLLN